MTFTRPNMAVRYSSQCLSPHPARGREQVPPSTLFNIRSAHTARPCTTTILPRIPDRDSGTSSGIDVVGLQLGMTQEELLSAVRRHNARLALMEHSSDIVVKDSYHRPYQVGSYVAEIQGYWDPRVQTERSTGTHKCGVQRASERTPGGVHFTRRQVRGQEHVSRL